MKSIVLLICITLFSSVIVAQSSNNWTRDSTNNDLYYLDGNVGIGTVNSNDWKLAVGGKIRAGEIKVETGWADYVFNDNYNLPSLEEVEAFINKEGRLINIPSADDIHKNGLTLGESNKLLLEKIEELTLYLIELDEARKSIKSRLKIITTKIENPPTDQ